MKKSRSFIKAFFSISCIVFSTHPAASGFNFEERNPKFCWDMLYVTVDLLSVDTLKILAFFTPLYIGTRIIDHEVHCCFYSHNHHKNLCQMNKNVSTVADKASMGISLGLASLAIFSSNEDLRRTARVFASGLLPIWAIKNIFKEVKHCGNIRPKCEYFNRYKKYYGGCPSGHMAFITYAATLFGLEYGPWWGVPLGATAIAVFGSSCNTNRHFVSQLVAGAAVGVIFGWSAHKVLEDYKLFENCECSLVSDSNMPVGLSISCSF